MAPNGHKNMSENALIYFLNIRLILIKLAHDNIIDAPTNRLFLCSLKTQNLGFGFSMSRENPKPRFWVFNEQRNSRETGFKNRKPRFLVFKNLGFGFSMSRETAYKCLKAEISDIGCET